MTTTTTTTIDTITITQISTLRDESGAAGDTAMVRICDAALVGDRAAIAQCARCIASAEAMDDGEG